MQVVILAGGLGTRLSEETDLIPKPMVRIGDIPILHHIMNYYKSFGHNKFLIAAGYKSEIIEKYCSTISYSDDIKVVNTGLHLSTGGRIKYLENDLDDNFFLTYGDGLSDINLNNLLKFHKEMGLLISVSAVRPPARFGVLEINTDKIVTKFAEKEQSDVGWINGGFFCCNKGVINYITDLQDPFENLPLKNLSKDRQLSAFEHEGWWQPMDTLREKRVLQKLFIDGQAPWLKYGSI
jgi:glucose-1-phosphate cytidylyltransferase